MSEPIALTHIEAVFIESDPFSSRVEPGVIDSEYALLPAEFLEALADLYCRRDNVACWQCGDLTGYVIVAQASGFDGMEWRPTGLAREFGAPVAVLCEVCAPYIPKVDYRTALDPERVQEVSP